MQNYEIRILTPDNQGDSIWHIVARDDAEAVEKARATTRTVQPFEVWRGDVCIYRWRAPDRAPRDKP
jgi:hypothetical protein